MEEHGVIDKGELVDGKYKYDQVYIIPLEPMKKLEDTPLEAADCIRFTIKAGNTPAEGRDHLEDVVRKVLDISIDEFLGGFDDTAA